MSQYVYTGDSITLIINNEPYILKKGSHPLFDKVCELVKSEAWDEIEKLLDIKKAIHEFSDGRVVVKGDKVHFDGSVLHNALTKRILSMIQEGFNVQPLVNFLMNLNKNPSKTAVNELYEFLECNDLPVTEDGHFLAYKKVTAEFKDIYTGEIDNSVGARPSMKRNEVDDERHRTCSTGLHFCSYNYLPHFGSNNPEHTQVVIVKINPKDVVSIPSDYNNAKGRCCEYEVIGVYGEVGDEYEDKLADPEFKASLNDAEE